MESSEARHRIPKQSRSELTFARIVETTERLYRERRTVAIPVREICDAAEVSRSSFYARFPDSTALTHYCYRRFQKRVFAMLAGLEVEWAQGCGDDPRLDIYVPFMIDRQLQFFNANLTLLEAFRAGESTDAELLALRDDFNRKIIALSIEITCRQFAELDRTAIAQGLARDMPLIASAFRGAIDLPDWIGSVSDESRHEFVSRLSGLILKVLRRLTTHSADETIANASA